MTFWSPWLRIILKLSTIPSRSAAVTSNLVLMLLARQIKKLFQSMWITTTVYMTSCILHVASSPGPFPACTLKRHFSVCSIESWKWAWGQTVYCTCERYWICIHLKFLSWYCRLNVLLHSDLVDDFVAALELLSSPELIFKVLGYLRERERCSEFSLFTSWKHP